MVPADPQLGVNIFFKSGQSRTRHLFSEGTPLPTSWSKSFEFPSDKPDDALEFQLLQGKTIESFSARKLRRWRISGITPPPSGNCLVQVNIHIADDGWISIGANQEKRHLKTISDTDTLVRAPVIFASPPSNPLDSIIRRIQAGESAIAEEQLTKLLENDSDNLEAWELLVSIVHDPAKKVECYRQILLRDPGNRIAATGMASMADINPKPVVNLVSNHTQLNHKNETDAVKCPHCSGEMQIHSLGELKPKASCMACNKTLDLPDWFFQYYQSESNEYQITGASNSSVQLGHHSHENEDMRLLHKIFPDMKTTDESGKSKKAKSQDLTPDEIIKLAGGPLPPGERHRCHNCDAVISRAEAKCPWCSKSLHMSS